MNKLDLRNDETRTRVIAVVLIFAVLVTSVISWQVSRSEQASRETNSAADKLIKEPTKKELAALAAASEKWTKVSTKQDGLSMRIPDGWTVITFPDNRIGATIVTYSPGTTPTTESIDNPYASYELRLSARVTIGNISDPLRPQWESPQPGLTETVTDFNLGDIKGKRFRGIFNNTLHQTLYQYVFDLGRGKRLNVVYTIYNGDKTDLATVQQAIRTITVKK